MKLTVKNFSTDLHFYQNAPKLRYQYHHVTCLVLAETIKKMMVFLHFFCSLYIRIYFVGVAEESLNFIPSTSTSTIESSIPEAVEKNCDESVASAVLYVGKNNSRLGRILALPEQGGKIRLVGELMIGLPKEEHASLKLLLSLHKFGDTTMNGCRNIGPPLQFVEIPQTSEQQDGKDVEPVTEIQINHYWHDADSDKPILVDVHLFIVDRGTIQQI